MVWSYAHFSIPATFCHRYIQSELLVLSWPLQCYPFKPFPYMSLCQKCSARTIHFLVVNASSGLSFLWTNLTLSERVCIKEIIKINLTPKVTFELVKYKNVHQVWAENWQRVDILGALIQLSFCLHLSSSGNFRFAASQDIVKAF